MRYIAVQWHHDCPSDPIEMYSELDEAGWEQRKVEVFADGSCDHADETEQTGSTMLGLVPIPPLTDIAADRQFTPREISQSEFETIWASARK